MGLRGAISALCRNLLLGASQVPRILKWSSVVSLKPTLLKCSLETATMTSWHLPAVVSNLFISIVCHHYADSMRFRYMLFSAGLYSGIKLMELVFRVVMPSCYCILFGIFNNVVKCRIHLLIKRRASSYLQSAISVSREGASLSVQAHPQSLLDSKNQGLPKLSNFSYLLVCIHCLAQWWLVFSGHRSHLSKPLGLQAATFRPFGELREWETGGEECE